MRVVRLLANLGYGSQKDVRYLLRAGRVTTAAGLRLGENDTVEPGDVRLDGQPLDPPAGLVLMLNKPADYTCSRADPGRIVYELLPERFSHRNPVLAPVGRLDRDTTGLLLMTDDGQLLHRITAPKAHVAKVYEVTLARPLDGSEIEVFASGTLMLRSEKTPLAPAQLEILTERRARLTLHEGRYHQAKRMFAALGNHVESLHRAGIGGLTLGDLPVGQWRVVDAADLAALWQGRAEDA